MRKHKRVRFKKSWIVSFSIIILWGCFNFLYSYDSGYIGGNTCRLYVDKEIFSAIRDSIKEAKHKIYLNIYEFQDFDIADILIEKARKGLEVKVILDRDAKGNRITKRYLGKYRVPTVYYPTVEKGEINHVKLLIIDSKKVIIGGANLGVHSPENHDIAILIEGKSVAEFENIFFEDWQKSTIKKSNATILKQKYPVDKQGIDTLKIVTDYDIRRELLKNIDNSKISISIEMFVLSDFEVLRAIIKAKERGVNLDIILDPNQLNNYDSEEELKKGNIKVKWYPIDKDKKQRMHMKLAIFDKENALFGSANFSYSGLKINHEIDVVANNKKIIDELTKMFEIDFQNSLLDSPVDKNSIKKTKKRKF